MDDGLKQRLIGAFVLLALAVIFLPVLFDRERIEPVDKRTQIPPAPHIDPVIVEEAAAPVVEYVAPEPKEMFVPDDANEENLAPEPPGFDNNGTPKSWVLQVASFRFEKHAEQLRDRLLEDGFSAYTKDVVTDRGKMTRVYIGPKLDKNDLLAAKSAIKEKHNLSSILLRFEP